MRKHLTAALIFVALTLILTNPLVLHVWNSVEDKQDGLLNTWITAWVGHALVTDPLHLFNTNIFYPYANTLAYSEILLPPSLFALPFTLATNNPIFGYNLALLAMLWLDAFGMYLFVVDMTRRSEAAWIAGAIYAFNPFNLGNFAQMQLLTLGFLPLALLFFGKMLRAGQGQTSSLTGESARRVTKYAFLFALFFILQSLSSFYYALLSGFAIALFFAWWLISRRANFVPSLRRALVPLAASSALVALVVIPFLLPYFEVQRELGFQRTVQESEPFSASLKQFTEVAPQNVLYGRFLSPNPVKRVGGYPLDNLFPGLVALLLALVGVYASRARAKSFLIVLLAIALILALGPRLYLSSTAPTAITLPYRWLYDIFPPLRALRAPVRFAAMINFALAALAGLGTVSFLDRFSPRSATVPATSRIALGIVVLICAEYLALPAANTVPLPVANEIPGVYKWLAQQPPGVALELPMMGPNDKNELDISTQYFTTYHWQKTPDGYSGFIPPRRGEVAYEMQTYPSVRAVALLRALDVNLVLDHVGAKDCAVFSGPIGYTKPGNEGKFADTCVYSIPGTPPDAPNLEKQIYAPSTVSAGAPLNAYLILVNSGDLPYAVKPTDRVHVEAAWSSGTTDSQELALPLVTSSVSVVPVPLTAPPRAGTYTLRVRSQDPLLGTMDADTTVTVGGELAREIVLPASVALAQPLKQAYARGEPLAVNLKWLPYNKINAYYSASVRLVNAAGDKIANTDRQPQTPTLLWQPDVQVADSFALNVPPDAPPGMYRVEVLMYQADTDVTALLLDRAFKPQLVIVLGEISVK